MDSTTFIRTIRQWGSFKCDTRAGKSGFTFTCVGDPHHNCKFVLNAGYASMVRTVRKNFRAKSRGPNRIKAPNSLRT